MIRIKRKKDVRYYTRVFLSSVITVILLAAFMHFFRDESFFGVLDRFWSLPFLITFAFLAYNFIREKLFSGLESATEEREFIVHMSRLIKDRLKINEEQALSLRNDATFQAVMKDAYLVYRDGEGEEKNYAALQSKLDAKKSDLVQKAGAIVIDETKKLREKKIRHQ